MKDKKTHALFDPAIDVGMICRTHCFDNGVIMRAVGDRMIIAPPLVMTTGDIDEMVTLIRHGAGSDTAQGSEVPWAGLIVAKLVEYANAILFFGVVFALL